MKKSRQEKPLGEAGVSEERMGSLQAEEALGDGQSEEDRQAFWNPEEGESDPLNRFGSGVASQPLVPRQTVMRTLGPRDRRRGASPGAGESRVHLDL